MKLQYRIPLAIYSVWCIIAIFALQGWLVPDEHMDASRDIGDDSSPAVSPSVFHSA